MSQSLQVQASKSLQVQASKSLQVQASQSLQVQASQSLQASQNLQASQSLSSRTLSSFGLLPFKEALERRPVTGSRVATEVQFAATDSKVVKVAMSPK